MRKALKGIAGTAVLVAMAIGPVSASSAEVTWHCPPGTSDHHYCTKIVHCEKQGPRHHDCRRDGGRGDH